MKALLTKCHITVFSQLMLVFTLVLAIPRSGGGGFH